MIAIKVLELLDCAMGGFREGEGRNGKWAGIAGGIDFE